MILLCIRKKIAACEPPPVPRHGQGGQPACVLQLADVTPRGKIPDEDLILIWGARETDGDEFTVVGKNGLLCSGEFGGDRHARRNRRFGCRGVREGDQYHHHRCGTHRLSDSGFEIFPGDRTVNEVLTVGRQEISVSVQLMLQELCDQYRGGTE